MQHHAYVLARSLNNNEDLGNCVFFKITVIFWCKTIVWIPFPSLYMQFKSMLNSDNSLVKLHYWMFRKTGGKNAKPNNPPSVKSGGWSFTAVSTCHKAQRKKKSSSFNYFLHVYFSFLFHFNVENLSLENYLRWKLLSEAFFSSVSASIVLKIDGIPQVLKHFTYTIRSECLNFPSIFYFFCQRHFHWWC